jgi:hypothetical protein
MGGKPSKGTPADRRLAVNRGTGGSKKSGGSSMTGKPASGMPMKPPHGKPMAAPRRGTPKHH